MRVRSSPLAGPGSGPAGIYQLILASLPKADPEARGRRRDPLEDSAGLQKGHTERRETRIHFLA
jgi:hypothetical protein